MIDYETKFRNALKAMQEKGLAWANASSQAWILEKMEKTMLANLTLEQEGASWTEKERKALVDKRYLTHLEGTQEAIRQRNSAKVKYDTAALVVESLRSLSSQETAKIKLGEN